VKASQESAKVYQEKLDLIQVMLEAKVEVCQEVIGTMQKEMKASQEKMEAI
jgi:hypothetical protein